MTLPTCSVCQDPNVVAINTALQQHVTLRQLEAQFPSVSRSALSRHREHLQASEPVPALVPPWDEEEQDHRRAQLVQAIADTQHAVHAALAAIDQQADALGKVMAIQHIRGFAAHRSDDDISRTEEYRQFMQRPKRAEEALEHAVATWRVALRELARARNRVAEHDHAGVRARRQHLYVRTPAGQALQVQ